MNRLITILSCLLLLTCQQSKNDKSKINTEAVSQEAQNTEITNVDNSRDTLINTDNYLIIGNKSAKVKIIDESEEASYPDYNYLNSYGHDVFIGKDTDQFEIYRKYNPQTTFDDFPAEIYNGPLADPDFSTNPEAKQFISRIKEACANGINFAGHYTMVIWGCGTSCQTGVVVDRKTGKIFDGPTTFLGSEFKKESNMIIINFGAIDTSKNLIEVCAYCEVTQDIWTGSGFKLIE